MHFDSFYTTALIRWSHIICGILWIGFFLFLHFIARPYVAGLKGEAKAQAYKGLIGRGINWCRGAGLATLLLGVGVLGHLWASGVYKTATEPLNGRGRFIMWAMTIAFVMLGNLFFFITKTQKGILNAFAAGIGPSDEQIGKARKLGLINVYLSGPMLYLMVMANNFGAFHYGHMALGLVIGGGVMHILVMIADKGSKKLA